jgi:uncharacterized membrane protein
MTLLIAGVVIWSLIHFIPATAISFRKGLIGKMGMVPYKGMFALVAIAALVFMVSGWQAAAPEPLFMPPSWGAYVTILMMFLAFILFFAPYIQNSFSQFLRHPQLAGVLVFGAGHLFSNGEARSLILFGGLAVWAFIQMILLNRRDGAWTKPGSASVLQNFRLLLAGFGFFALFMYIHGWLFGTGPLLYI